MISTYGAPHPPARWPSWISKVYPDRRQQRGAQTGAPSAPPRPRWAPRGSAMHRPAVNTIVLAPQKAAAATSWRQRQPAGRRQSGGPGDEDGLPSHTRGSRTGSTLLREHRGAGRFPPPGSFWGRAKPVTSGRACLLVGRGMSMPKFQGCLRHFRDGHDAGHTISGDVDKSSTPLHRAMGDRSKRRARSTQRRRPDGCCGRTQS